MRQKSTQAQSVFVAIAAFFLLFSMWGLPALSQTSSPTFNKDDVLQEYLRNYILNHPEVLIESLQRAREKQQEHSAELKKSKIMGFRKDFFEDSNAPILGNPAGDVTLVEFFDYQCPYCHQVEPWLQTLIKEDPGVRIVQKEFPILGPGSVYAAHAAVAAQKQGKHTQFHNALMAKKVREGDLNETIVLQVAEAVGLDIGRLKVDMDSPEVKAEIRRTAEIAKALELSGTPAFIAGTRLVPGATDLATFKLMIEDARRGID